MRHEAILINVGKERVKEGLFHSETGACVLVEQSINLSFKNTAQFVERNWGKKKQQQSKQHSTCCATLRMGKQEVWPHFSIQPCCLLLIESYKDIQVLAKLRNEGMTEGEKLSLRRGKKFAHVCLNRTSVSVRGSFCKQMYVI